MNKEDILAMEPGDEMDRLISEAFGDAYDHPNYGRLYRHFEENITGGGWSVPSKISTDILLAWGLLKKMGKHAQITIELRNKPEEIAPFIVIPFDIDKAPEAICKAALLAKIKQ